MADQNTDSFSNENKPHIEYSDALARLFADHMGVDATQEFFDSVYDAVEQINAETK